MQRKLKLKYMFKLLKLGLKNPRFYIEALNLKWKNLFVLSLLAMLALSGSIVVQTLPLIDSISNDVTAAVDHVPEFQFEDGLLKLEDNEKSLYYQSNFFQLVIDDTVSSRGMQNYIPIDTTKANKLSTDTLLNLLVLQDQTIVIIAGNFYRIPDYYHLFSNQDSLITLLQSIDSQKATMLTSVFITAFIFSFFIYWFQMLLIAAVAGWFNARLTQKILFKMRLKLSIIVSFVPLILLQLMDAILPFFRSSYFMLMFITLYIIYLAFKNHTEFIRNLMQKINKNELDKNEEESQR